MWRVGNTLVAASQALVRLGKKKIRCQGQESGVFVLDIGFLNRK